MMGVAHVPQSASLDLGVPLTGARFVVIGPEKPRRSAAGKRCAAPSDRSSATLGKETFAIEQRGSSAVDWTVPRVDGVALGAEDLKARYCDWLASEGLSHVLDLESSPQPARTPSHISGDTRTDPLHEPGESRLGRTAHSRRTAQARHRHRRDQRQQVPGAQPKATLTNLANVPGKPPPKPGFH